MVDPKSWIRHSGLRDLHMHEKHAAFQRFSVYDYHKYLGYGCECALCDQILDRSEPILPIRDFRYAGRDGSNEILNDDFYLLCSPVVHGYALKERQWGTHDIDSPSSLSTITDYHS
jgi:hypothetical protein